MSLKVKDGNTWVELPTGGVGVPSGGTTGQYLRKSSSADYATEWAAEDSHDWTLLVGKTEIVYASGGKKIADLPSSWSELLVYTSYNTSISSYYPCYITSDIVSALGDAKFTVGYSGGFTQLQVINNALYYFDNNTHSNIYAVVYYK